MARYTTHPRRGAKAPSSNYSYILLKSSFRGAIGSLVLIALQIAEQYSFLVASWMALVLVLGKPYRPRWLICAVNLAKASMGSTTLWLPEDGLSKESEISQRIVRRDGGPVQGRRPCTQPSRQAECRWKRPVKETQEPPTKSAVLLFAGYVSIKFGR